MFTVHVQFTVDEAISLMRAIAAKQWAEADEEKREDLELVRLKLYDKVYRSQTAQPAAISIDTGRLLNYTRRDAFVDTLKSQADLATLSEPAPRAA
ncbi:MAG TPA: hypothetical protein VE621_13095 [Bryobacteraceae bacterium]|nr:hypothetical protein [Bryobacteraceae bacterium]